MHLGRRSLWSIYGIKTGCIAQPVLNFFEQTFFYSPKNERSRRVSRCQCGAYQVERSVDAQALVATVTGKTFAGIPRDLAADGYTTRSGARWQRPQVKHIVRHGVYAGYRQWNGKTMSATKGLPASSRKLGRPMKLP